jgi:hypothetical protein
LPNLHPPRIVTSIVSGKRQVFVIASMLMQLPTPLDCINRAPRIETRLDRIERRLDLVPAATS